MEELLKRWEAEMAEHNANAEEYKDEFILFAHEEKTKAAQLKACIEELKKEVAA